MVTITGTIHIVCDSSRSFWPHNSIRFPSLSSWKTAMSTSPALAPEISIQVTVALVGNNLAVRV